MDDLRARTLSGIVWNGSAHAARQFVQFVVTVILARLLSPQEFGLVAMVAVFLGFMNILSAMGLGAAIIQRCGLEARHLHSVFWLTVVLGVLLTGVGISVSPVAARFYGEASLEKITIVLSLNFLCVSLSHVPSALLFKSMDFRRIARVEITAVLVSGVVAIAMALSGCGVWSLVTQSLAHSIVSTALIWCVTPWRPALSFEFVAIGEMLRFSGHLVGFETLNYWVRNLDNLLIGKYVGSSALGIYERAYRLMLLPGTQISWIASQVMFPALSVIQREVDKVKSAYLRSTRLIALITFPLMIGLLVTARPLVLTVYGDKWAAVVPILRVLCLSGLAQSIGTTVGWIYNSQGRTDLLFKWGLFSGVVRWSAVVVGLKWGVLGVAAAYVLSQYLILWYPSWAIPFRLINLRFTEMLRNLAAPFSCALAMGVAVWMLGCYLPSHWPECGRLAGQVSLGILCYALLLHLFKVRAYSEARELVKEIWACRSRRSPPPSSADNNLPRATVSSASSDQ